MKKYMAFSRNALLHFKQIPLWNDHLATVHLELSTIPVFYPPFWAASLLSANQEIGFRVFTILHVAMWGPAFYFLMRYGLRYGFTGSFLGAAGMAFSPLFLSGLINGYITENITFPYFVLSLAFFLRAYLEPASRPWRNIFFAGFFLGWMFLAGGGFLYLYAVLFYFFLMLFGSFYKFFALRRSLRQIGIQWMRTASMLLVSLGLSAAHFFPAFLFLSFETGRSLNSYETMIGQVVPLTYYLLDFLRAYSSSLGFVFISIVLLAILARKSLYQERIFLFFSLLLVFLWITWGRAAPVDFYYLIYKYFPGFKNNHDTTRFIILAYSCFFVLVGASAEWLREKFLKTKTAFACAFIFLFAVLIHLSVEKNKVLGNYYSQNSQASQAAPSEVETFLKQIIKNNPLDYPKFRLLPYHSFHVDYHRPDSKIIDNQIQVFPPSEAIAGSAPNFVLTHFYEWDPFGAEYRFRLLGLLNVRYLTSREPPIPYPDKNARLFDRRYLKKIASLSDGTVYENLANQPRILFPQNAILFLVSPKQKRDMETLAEIRRFIFKGERDFKNEIILIGTPADFESLAGVGKFIEIYVSNILPNKMPDFLKKIPAVRTVQDRLVKGFSGYILGRENDLQHNGILEAGPHINERLFTPNYIQLDVTVPSNERTFLYLGDPYASSWKAYDNGKPIPVYLADGVGRGICITRDGNHRILFKFEPPFFKFFLLLSIVSFTVVIFVLFRPSNAQIMVLHN